MSLPELPTELLLQITGESDTPSDVLSLALTSKTLYNILGETTILEKDAEYQKLQANDFARLANFHQDYYTNLVLGPYKRPNEPILHWAIAKHADISVVERALDVFQKCFPESLNGGWNPFWPSPLVAAIRARRLDVVQLLLSKGCDANGGSRRQGGRIFEEDSVLVACKLGDTAIAELLLNNDAETHEIDTMCAAVQRGMPSIVTILIKKYHSETESRRDIIHALSRREYLGHLESSQELIEVMLAGERGQDRVYEWTCFALKHSYWQIANYFWDIFVREHMKPGVNVKELLHMAVRNDNTLHMTKHICEEFPSEGLYCYHYQSFELLPDEYDENGDKRDKGEMLRGWLLSLSTSQLTPPNIRTIQYLVDSGGKFVPGHLNGATFHGNYVMVESIVAKDPSLLERQLGNGWRVIDQALYDTNWSNAFSLIYLGAKVESIPEEIRDHLQTWAIKIFVLQKTGWPRDDDYAWVWPRLIPQWSYVELLDFIGSIMSIRPLPDKSVFAPNVDSIKRKLMIQLWTLFQLVLGVDFIEESRRLAVANIDDYSSDDDSSDDDSSDDDSSDDDSSDDDSSDDDYSYYGYGHGYHDDFLDDSDDDPNDVSI